MLYRVLCVVSYVTAIGVGQSVNQRRLGDGGRCDEMVVQRLPQIAHPPRHFSFANSRRANENDIHIWVEVRAQTFDPDFPLQDSGYGRDSRPLSPDNRRSGIVCVRYERIYPVGAQCKKSFSRRCGFGRSRNSCPVHLLSPCRFDFGFPMRSSAQRLFS